MRFHAMCVVKNEADVLAETLTRAAAWCDHIYVFDNASTDGSWEIVLDLARRHPQIVPFRQSDQVFTERLRRDIFMNYRDRAEPGDWWCRLDADEIYIDNPRDFLPQVPKQFDLVWGALFQYCFTDQDLIRYEQEPSLYDDGVPVGQKCRYYINNWSEPRFFRQHNGLFWRNKPKNGWPSLVTHFADRRIRVKHYQYRSPQQIQRRIAVRWQAAARGGFPFPHEVLAGFRQSIGDVPEVTKADEWAKRAQLRAVELGGPPEDAWRQRVVSASGLVLDGSESDYVLREDLMPAIPHVTPTKRLARKVLRTCFSPFADWI